MNEINREKLAALNEKLLDRALAMREDDDEFGNALNDVNLGIDRELALEKADKEYEAQLAKIEAEEQKSMREDETRKSESKKDRLVQVGLFLGGLTLGGVADLFCKKNLAKYIGTIEQMETFTSSAGRSIGSWFRFKK